MKSRVLLKTLESVSLKTKSGSKTIALYNFLLSNEPDGSFPNRCRSQELGLDNVPVATCLELASLDLRKGQPNEAICHARNS